MRFRFSLLAAILLATALPASAASYHVCPDGSGDFETIQAAIDASVNGDVIELCDGVFSGPGNAAIRYHGKEITVRSRSGNPEECVIDFGGLAGGILFQEGETSAAVLQGVTVKGGNAGGGGGGGIVCWGASPQIVNCRIAGNRAALGGGIYVEAGSPSISGCVIVGNLAMGSPHYGGRGGGVWCYASARIEECTITGNWSEGRGGGIYLGGTTAPELVNCTIASNVGVDGGGLYLSGAVSASMDRCVAWGNCASAAGDEILVKDAATAATLTCTDVDSSGVAGAGTVQYVADNLFIDPLFCDPADCSAAPTTTGDYRLAENSPCLDAPGCGLIGAFEQGCGPIGVETSSWGWLKALYR